MKDLSVKNILSLGWKDLKNNWKIILLAVFLIFVISTVINWNAYDLEINPDGYKGLNILSEVFSVYITAGLILESLKITDGKKASIKKIFLWFKDWKHLLKFFVAYILYSLIALLPGLIIGIVFITNPNLIVGFMLPALIIAVIYAMVIGVYISFAYYLVAENRNGIIDSIKKSFKMVNNNLKKVLAFYWAFIWRSIFYIGFPIIILSAVWGGLSFNEIDSSIFSLIIPVVMAVVILIMLTWIGLSFNHLYRSIDPDVKRVEE